MLSPLSPIQSPADCPLTCRSLIRQPISRQTRQTQTLARKILLPPPPSAPPSPMRLILLWRMAEGTEKHSPSPARGLARLAVRYPFRWKERLSPATAPTTPLFQRPFRLGRPRPTAGREQAVCWSRWAGRRRPHNRHITSIQASIWSALLRYLTPPGRETTSRSPIPPPTTRGSVLRKGRWTLREDSALCPLLSFHGEALPLK